METRGRSRKNNRSRDMLLALKGKVTNLEESMSSVKETLKTKKLTKSNDVLEASIVTLKEETKVVIEKLEELEGELALYRAAVGKGKLTLVPKQHKMDILKSKEFNGTRFARDVEDFLWGWKSTFVW
ncbi:hypothetical protein Gotri_011245 [Gossypium trilobum]|uniref:Uncharacterized protein n=1 Tax=Gossypium trilobum TaxID=34281 RepID=A0A7J9EUR5_9ROSI|nr:hypothetical protein [Gossypium trilobum]